MAELIPQSSLACAGIDLFPQDLCIQFPGGLEICVQTPDLNFPQPLELVKQLFAQLNSALAPLMPFFKLLDVVLALVTCVKGIPQGPTEFPPFKTLIGCIPNLIEKLKDVIALIPFLSIPFTVLGFIDATLAMLEGITLAITEQIDQLVAIADAATRAEHLGSHALGLIADCATHDLGLEMANLNESIRPLNLMFGLINAFMELIGLPGIPELATLGANPRDALAPIQNFTLELRRIRSLIPV